MKMRITDCECYYKNLTCIPMILLKLIFLFHYRNATIILTVTVHIENNMIEINANRNKHICKNFFLLALLFSIAPVDAAFDALVTILVMAPVDAGFSGGYKPICPIWLTLGLHLALQFRLLHNRNTAVLFG